MSDQVPAVPAKLRLVTPTTAAGMRSVNFLAIANYHVVLPLPPGGPRA